MYSIVSERCCQSTTPIWGDKPEHDQAVLLGRRGRLSWASPLVTLSKVLADQVRAPTDLHVRARRQDDDQCNDRPAGRGHRLIGLSMIGVSPLGAGRHRDGAL